MNFGVLWFFALAANSAYAASNISPTLYSLELYVDTTANAFTGSLIIDAQVTAGGAVDFLLNNHNLTISTVSVRQQGGGDLFSFMTNTPKAQTTLISLKQGLSSSQPVQITVAYSGKISSEPTGLYSFVDNGKSYFMTNLYPIHARKVFPCIDEPSAVASFLLRLVLPNSANPISSTPLVSQSQTNNGFYTYQFAQTAKIPPSSLFFTWGDWNNQAFSVPMVNTVFWVPSSLTSKTNAFDKALTTIFDEKSTLRQLMSFFDTPINIFVSPKMDQDSYSGLGTVVLKTDIVVNNLQETTTHMQIKHFINIGYAFYNLYFNTYVWPSNWGNSWLTRSIPIYLAHQGLNEIDGLPFGSSDEHFVTGIDEKVFNTLWAPDSPVPYVTNPPTTPDGIVSLVFSNAVNKGVFAIKTLESFVKPNMLKAAIVNYLIKKNGTALDTEGFAQFLQDTIKPTVISGSIKDILIPIVSQPGYPLIKMSRYQYTLSMQKSNFMQVQPSLLATSDKLSDVNSWLLPVTVLTSLNPNPNNSDIYFIPANTDNPLDLNGIYQSSSWAVLDLDGKGIMRVSYDDLTWMLFNSAVPSTFSAATRAKLISDAFATAEAQTQSWVTTLYFLQMLDREQDLAPWKAALSGFDRMWNWIYQTGTQGNGSKQLNLASDFTSFVRQRLYNIYQKLGTLGNEKDSADPLRREIVNAMCKYGSAECVTNLANQYQDMVNGKQSPSPNMFEVVVCNGLRGVTSATEWNPVFQSYVYSGMWYSYDLEESHFRFLSCPNSNSNEYSDPIDAYLKNVLLYTTQRRFPNHLVKPAVVAILDKPQHVNQVLSFLLSNQEKLNVSVDVQADLMSELGKRLSTPEQSTQLSTFLNGHPKISTTLETAIKSAIAAADAKSKWILQVQKDVQTGLKGVTPSPQTEHPPTTGGATTGVTGASTGKSTGMTTNMPPTTKGAATLGVSTAAILLSLAAVF